MLPGTRNEKKGLAVAAALFAAGVLPLLFVKFRSGFVPGDLNIYRAAGELALHGRTPYGPGFGAGLRVRLPFTYPPAAAFLVVPLSIQPARLAQVTWSAVNLGLLVALVWWLFRPAFRKAGLMHPAWLALAAAALAWTVPLGQNLAYGQVNLALATACLVDCTRTSRHRGILVGVATAFKLTPGMFIAYFVVTKQWAAARRAAVTFAGLQLVAAAILPGAARDYWLHLVFQANRPGDPLRFFNQSLYGDILRLGGPAWLWLPAAGAAAALGLWRARRAHLAGSEVAAVAIVGLTAVLVSPISWQHHAVWIVPMFAVLATWATTPGRRAAVAGLLVLFIVPVPQIGNVLVTAHHLPVLNRVLESSDLLIFLWVLAALPLVAVGQDSPSADRAMNSTSLPSGSST